MEIISNAGLGIGVLMFLLMLFKRQKKHEDLIFLAWIAITLLQITFYQSTLFRFPLYGFWAVSSFGLPLLGAPLLFLYILALTGHKLTFKILLQHLGIYFLYMHWTFAAGTDQSYRSNSFRRLSFVAFRCSDLDTVLPRSLGDFRISLFRLGCSAAASPSK